MPEYSQVRAFNVGIAEEVSVEGALIYDDLVYAQKNFGEGWFYRSYDMLLRRFPMYSESTIRRHIKKLEEGGWIRTKVKKVDGIPLCHFQIDRSLSVKLTESMETVKLTESILDNNYKTTQKDAEGSKSSFGAEASPHSAPPPSPNPVVNLLQEIINIVNPREKVTVERKRMLHARLKDYTTDEIVSAARALSRSTWHRSNKQMSIDNLLAPSKFGRWYAQRTQEPSGDAYGYVNGLKIITEDENGRKYWGGELITPENQDRVLEERNAQ